MKSILLVSLFTLLNAASISWGAEPMKEKETMSMNLTKEDREKMATAHEQMAACLRSDQDMLKCHEALQKSCESMGSGLCREMGMWGKQHKMKYRK